MGAKKAVILMVLMWWGSLVWGQVETFNPIKDAIKTGNAKEVVKHFNQSLDINLEGEVNTYSKAQAEFVLRDFFKKHPATDFSIVHSGSSKGGLLYAIGNYKSNNDVYNVLIRVKQAGSTYLVHEISFVKE